MRGNRVAARSLVLLLGTSLAIGATATPAGAQPSRAEHFTASLALRADTDQPVWSTVNAHGAFEDNGTVRFEDDPNGVHHDIFVFANGTVDLAEIAKTDAFSFDPATCVGKDREAGSYQMTGTGRYARLTGRGTWHHEATVVAPLEPGCSPDSPRTVGFVRFTASGPVDASHVRPARPGR